MAGPYWVGPSNAEQLFFCFAKCFHGFIMLASLVKFLAIITQRLELR